MKLKTNLLPLLTVTRGAGVQLTCLQVTWIGPYSLLAAGHDCVPVLFAVDGGNRVSQGLKLEETRSLIHRDFKCTPKPSFEGCN